MNNQAVNKETIVKYLLGSLPEAETERFDELSITNDEFAETLKAAENDLVDAYVQGDLTGVELERFRFHYLASPLRHEKVEFAEAFQVLGEKHAPEQAAEVWSRKTKPSSWFSGLSVFTAPRLALQWGFAALALAFLIAGGWLVFQNMRLRQQLSQTQAPQETPGQREQELQKELEGRRSSNERTEQELAQATEELRRLEEELKKKEQHRQPVNEKPEPSRRGGKSMLSFILAPQMRGMGQVPTVSIPADTDYVAMHLQLQSDYYPAYRAALLEPINDQILWRSSNLKAGGKGDRKTLSVRLRPGLLKPQTYLLQVSGVQANGVSEIVGDYPFRVVR